MRKIFLLLFIFSGMISAQSFQTLGTWNSVGIPNYLQQPGDNVPRDLLSRIDASVPEYSRVPVKHPEYLADNVQTNITVLQTADVFVTFVTEGAGYRNVLGFYTYDINNPPQTTQEIASSMTVIFPNTSLTGSGGGLKSGDKVKIGTFQPGTAIGWWLGADGFRNGNATSGNWLLYSNKSLNPETNPDKKQHNVLLNDLGSGRVILAFEDIRRDYGSCDEDFNDAIFYVSATPTNAISYENVVLIEDPGNTALADLSLTKSADNTNPADGDIVTYTVALTNNGPNNATEIVVSEILPEGLIYKSHTTGAGEYDYSSGIWSIQGLTNGSTIELKVKAAVNLAAISQSAFDLGPAVDYNVFVFEDISQPSADTEGKVAVGRDAFFSSYSIGDQLDPSGGTEDVLIVGENLTFLSGTVKGGNVVYGQGTNLPIDMVTIFDGTLRQDSVINFEAASVYLNELAASLKVYEANGDVIFENSGLTLTGNDPFLNVFGVTGSQLNLATSLNITVPNGSVVLLNISGESIDWGGALNVYGTAISNVLYNFYECSDLIIEGIDVRGSILAPKATVDFPSGVVNGQVIAKSVLGTGQFNSGSDNSTHFIGNIPVSDKISNVSEILSVKQQDPNPSNNSSEAVLNLAGFGDPGNTGGVTWQLTGNTGTGEIVWVLDQDDAGNFISGTWGGKIYRSTNEGADWVLLNSGMNVAYIWDILIDGNTIYAATENGVYKSINNGSDWNITGLSGKDTRAITKSGTNIFAGTWGEGIFKSTNGGNNWTGVGKTNTNLPVHALESDASGNIYAGTFGSGVLRSKDGGESWDQLNFGYLFVWSLGIDSQGKVYAGTYGNGVIRSIDGGENWFAINNNLMASHIYSIRIDASNNVFVSGWSSGVYVLSADKSDEWGSLGMGTLGVSSLVIKNNILYAGTSSGNIYSNSSPLTSLNSRIDLKPAKYELVQNYPNPFNPSTTILFNIAEEGEYSLAIFNSIGQLIRTVAKGDYAPGEYNVKFDASGLSTGMYIYRLRGNGLDISRKMLLIK